MSRGHNKSERGEKENSSRLRPDISWVSPCLALLPVRLLVMGWLAGNSLLGLWHLHLQTVLVWSLGMSVFDSGGFWLIGGEFVFAQLK